MPDTSTEVAIATTTLSSTATSVTFSGISGAYTDLRLVARVSASANFVGVLVRFNSDTGTNYSDTYLNGNGSTASSSRNTGATYINLNPGNNFPTDPGGLLECDIFSYAGSTNKTVIATTSVDRNGAGTISKTVGLWRNTSAITSITMLTNAVDGYAAGSMFTLYGIL